MQLSLPLRSAELELAYVAGIFDGEGCVRMTRIRNSWFPSVYVANTNLELLEALRCQFGGQIYKQCGRRVGWKQGYNWRLSWSSAVEFLDLIRQWLLIKDQQADTIFAWDAMRLGYGKRMDQEVLELLVHRIKWLNKKGPRTEPDPIDAVLAEAA